MTREKKGNGSITQLPSGKYKVRLTIPATETSPMQVISQTVPTKKQAEQLLASLRRERDRAGDRPRISWACERG